jgi:abhydrolase domain-containing protein 17
MGLSQSSYNPISSLVFQPPIRSDKEFKNSNHTTTIKSNNFSIPLIHKKSNSSSCMIYSHGNATDLYDLEDMLTYLHNNLNIDVIGYDYVGYGFTQKFLNSYPSEYSCTQNLADIVKYANNHDYDNIILMGSSLGTGVTLNYVKHNNGFHGKVILESPFTSICSVVSPYLYNFSVDMFGNYDNIDHIHHPMLIIHGMNDEVVPFDHGVMLFDKHKKLMRKKKKVIYPPLWIKNAGHNDIIMNFGSKKYINELDKYIKH